MRITCGSRTECAKYSIARRRGWDGKKRGKKKRRKLYGRVYSRRGTAAAAAARGVYLNAANAKYARTFSAIKTKFSSGERPSTIRTAKKERKKKGFHFYVTGLKPICLDDGPSFLSRNAFCKRRLKWTPGDPGRRINFLRKPPLSAARLGK